MQCPLGRHFLWWLWSVFPYFFWLVLKSILSDSKMAMLVCFLGSICLEYLFPSFDPGMISVLDIKMFLDCNRMFLPPSPVFLLMLRDINEQCLLIPVILLVLCDVCVCVFHLFWFSGMGLFIACVFLCVVKLFILDFSF